MPKNLRKLGFAVLGVSLGLTGLSYANTGSPNPFKALSTTLSSHSSSATDIESPEPSESPEASESPDATATPGTSGVTPTATPRHGVDRSHDGCPEGFDGNHGQFVSGSEDHQTAAHSDCGKPVTSMHSPKPSETPEASSEPDDNGDHGDHGDHGNQGGNHDSQGGQGQQSGQQNGQDHGGHGGGDS